jgi:hypothetical protein
MSFEGLEYVFYVGRNGTDDLSSTWSSVQRLQSNSDIFFIYLYKGEYQINTLHTFITSPLVTNVRVVHMGLGDTAADVVIRSSNNSVSWNRYAAVSFSNITFAGYQTHHWNCRLLEYRGCIFKGLLCV